MLENTESNQPFIASQPFTHSQTCTLCQLDIAPERVQESPVICNHCGHSATPNEKSVVNKMERRCTQWMVALSVLFVASYIQLMNWDTHSLSVIQLSVKDAMGASTITDTEQMAAICFDLKKWDCVESEYRKIAQQKPEQWFELGRFQVKRAKTQAAAESFYAYFNGFNNQDPDQERQLEASYLYAKALAELGQVDEAVTYFEQVLASRPEVLQVTVVQNYVRMLMSHKRYEQAEKLIKDVRGQGPTAESFMEPEFQEIREMTSASTI